MANDRFILPARGSSFTTSDNIGFVVDELTNDRGDRIQAILFNVDTGKPLKTIGLWPAEVNRGKTFEFNWQVNVGAGHYAVCTYELDGDDRDNDFDEDLEDDFDDDSCSYPFSIGGVTPQSNSKELASASRKKRSIYAAY